MSGSGARGRKHPGHLRPTSLFTTTATQGETAENNSCPLPHAIHPTCVTFTCGIFDLCDTDTPCQDFPFQTLSSLPRPGSTALATLLTSRPHKKKLRNSGTRTLFHFDMLCSGLIQAQTKLLGIFHPATNVILVDEASSEMLAFYVVPHICLLHVHEVLVN